MIKLNYNPPTNIYADSEYTSFSSCVPEFFCVPRFGCLIVRNCLPSWCPPLGECMPDKVCAPDHWCPPNSECHPDCCPAEPCPTDENIYENAFKIYLG